MYWDNGESSVSAATVIPTPPRRVAHGAAADEQDREGDAVEVGARVRGGDAGGEGVDGEAQEEPEGGPGAEGFTAARVVHEGAWGGGARAVDGMRGAPAEGVEPAPAEGERLEHVW